MKGHIFNLLEEFLIEAVGINQYENLLEKCQFSTDAGFIRTANYPDEHLNELVDHAVVALGITKAQAQHSFGRWLLPHLAKLVPDNLMSHPHPRVFLNTVDYIHRVELKKLYPDALPPTFTYQDSDGGGAVLNYNSPRAMFDLVEGVLQGVADYYDTVMIVERRLRPDQGPGACDFLITYT